MGITFRHDAAAVALPSNQATRKYGQQLVMQQNQQKYAAQQAGYDRMFQLGRDQEQASRQAVMQGQQNARQTIRDATQFANEQTLLEQQNQFRQKQAEAERQAKFMDEARKQSSGMIMEDIKNEAYDPATARKLQQNLVAESEALGNPQLDATQRAEALAKIRAERAMLTAGRMEKPPAPTPDEEFQQSIATDPETGMRYRKNSKGDWDPLEQPKKPPASAAEAFQADSKTRDKYMADAVAIITEGGEKPLTRESRKEAATLAMELYESDNSPPAAQPLPGGASNGIQSATTAPPPAATGAERSILEQPQEIPVAAPDQGQPPSPDLAAYHQDMTRQGYTLKMFPDGVERYFKADPNQQQPSGASQPTTPPTQNPWAEVANPTANASSANPSQAALQPPKAQSPNFTELIRGTKDAEERRVLGALQGMYSGQTPEVQSAIGVILNEQSSLADLKAANDYLRSAGIDIDQLAKYQHQGGNRKGKSK